MKGLTGGLAAVAVIAALMAGCGKAPASGPASPAAARPPDVPGRPSLSATVVTGADTWAVVLLGGSAATHNDFWQLFVRPAAASRWRLATPPGVASNGGLVVAGTGGPSLVAAIRPSQLLAFTPLSATSDGGGRWSSDSPLDAPLADVPDSLAATQDGSGLLAVLSDGTVRLAASGNGNWRTLVSGRALAATPAGRRCGLRGLTAAAYTPAGTALLAGRCAHPGVAGIFADRGASWRGAWPVLPPVLAGQQVRVLRLTRTSAGDEALLSAGSGRRESLFAAWATAGGRGTGGRLTWRLSPAFALGEARMVAATFRLGGGIAVELNDGRARLVAGPGVAWRALPALPAGTAALAPGPAGGLDALAVHRAVLTVWRLGYGTRRWRMSQVIKVPIQLGSSG